MTTIDVDQIQDTPTPTPQPDASAAVLTSNPAIAGLPGFTLGALALALQLSGYLPATASTAVLPLTLGAAVSTIVATVWAARTGQDAVACVFGTFTCFWVSYTFFVFGLIHGWLMIPADQVVRTQSAFLITWLVVIVALTLGALRLPLAFFAALFLVDAAIVLNLIGVINASSTANQLAGFCAFGFTAIGFYLLVGALLAAGGGKGFPPGPPLVRS